MPAGASTSGADAGGGGGGGGMKHREHQQGNQERKATTEQVEAVVRIRRCEATAFYDILGIEAVRNSCTESDVKKAYRKQSLLTHPDKNGHEHAAEAFKMVAKAFSVLGDKDKKAKYDRFGGDPDSRFGTGGGGGDSGGGATGNPFAGFARRGPGGPGGFGFGEEISPEELFQRFFGGGAGGFGGDGMFGGGPQFVFNMGGGPGFRVHQFNGGRPRVRPQNTGQQRPQSDNPVRDLFIQLLPLIILFFVPIITNVLGAMFEAATAGVQSAMFPTSSYSSSSSSTFYTSSSSTTLPSAGTAAAKMPSAPKMVFEQADPEAGFTAMRQTPKLQIDYFVHEKDVESMPKKKLYDMDRMAEVIYMRVLKEGCTEEREHKKNLIEEARGLVHQDPDKMDLAVRYETPTCAKYEEYSVIWKG